MRPAKRTAHGTYTSRGYLQVGLLHRTAE